MTASLASPGPLLGAPPPADRKDAILRQSMLASWIIILLCFGGIGTWFAMARLDSAAVAAGVLENAGSTRTIQHLEGGIVREILVRDGDVVAEGQLLVRLDPTQSQASAALFGTQLQTSEARRQRLEAEASMQPALAFSDDLLAAAAGSAEIAQALGDERRQFDLRQAEVVESRGILLTNIGQAEAQIDALLVSRDIAERDLALIAADLADQRTLMERGLTSQAQITALERQKLEQEEKIAQSQIEIARIEQSIQGFRLQITQIEQDYRREAAASLELVTGAIRELQAQTTVANDSLERIEIRSPVSGTVQESILGTVGAVIGSGEVLMKIAPNADDRVVVARVSPDDIEGVVPGSLARMTFPAFAALLLEPALGEVISISRDRVVEPMTQQSFFEARIRLDEATLPAELRDRLVAGMSVTAVIPTGERTALEYLLGPILRRMQGAMRED
jgi:HlyD family type I secretion membrane fusion protein